MQIVPVGYLQKKLYKIIIIHNRKVKLCSIVIQYNLICAGVIVQNIDCDLKIFENITAQRLLPAPGQQNVTALLKGVSTVVEENV